MLTITISVICVISLVDSYTLSVCPSTDLEKLSLMNILASCSCRNVCQVSNMLNGSLFSRTMIVVNRYKNQIQLIEDLLCCSSMMPVLHNSYMSLEESIDKVCSSNSLPVVMLDIGPRNYVTEKLQLTNEQQCAVQNSDQIRGSLGRVIYSCKHVVLLVVDSAHLSTLNFANATTLKFVGTEEIEKQKMHEKPIRVTFAIEEYLPFYNITNSTDGEVTYYGMIFTMLAEIQQRLNLKFEMIVTSETTIGRDVGNNSWNGLIGLIANNKTDILVCAIIVTHDRKKIADFSDPFHYETIGVLINVPNAKFSILNLLLTFTPLLWAIILISFILAIVSMCALQNLSVASGEQGVGTLMESSWYVCSAQLNQEANRVVNSCSGRTFEVIWRLSAFIVVSTFTGGLYAAMTTRILNVPKTLDEFADALLENKYKMCINNNTAFAVSISNTFDNSTFGKINRWIKKHPEYANPVSGACTQRVLKEENTATLNQKGKLKSLQAEHCDRVNLVLLNDFTFPSCLALMLRKNFSYNAIISEQIRNMMSSGLLAGWYNKFATKPNCNILEPGQRITADTTPLEIDSVSGCFTIFLAGILFAFIALIGEAIYVRRKHHQTRNLPKNTPC